MKYLAAILLALMTVTAYAVQFFNSSDLNVGNFSKVKCGPSIKCSQSSGKLLIESIQTQVASTTTTLTTAQCGSTIVSNSADVVTLPEASTALGCRYTFVCGTADDFDVNPADATDVIGPVSTTNGTTGVVTLTPSAGDAIRCTDIGGSITLEAIGVDRWAQVGGGNGIWTDVN